MEPKNKHKDEEESGSGGGGGGESVASSKEFITLDLSHVLPNEKDLNDSLIDILNSTNNTDKKSWMSLSDNSFETINTPNLTKLELLNNIMSLDLSNNNLSQINPLFFQKISPGLLFLNLSHNNFTTIPDGIPSLTSLKTLDISFNLIESVPPWLSTLSTHIEDIRIIGNPLRSLPHTDSLLLRTGPQCFPLTTHSIIQYATSLTTPTEWTSGCIVSIGNDQPLKTALLRIITSNKAIEEPTPLSPLLATRVTVGNSLTPLQDLTIYDMRGEITDSVHPLPRLFSSSKTCVILAVCSCSEAKKEFTGKAVAGIANKVLRPLLGPEGQNARVVLVLEAIPQGFDNEWVESNVIPLLCVRPYSYFVWNNSKSVRKECSDSLRLLVKNAIMNDMEWRSGVLGCTNALSLFVKRMRMEKSFIKGKELCNWARKCYINDDYIPTAISTLWHSGELFLFSNDNNYSPLKNTFANFDDVDVFLSPSLLADVVLTLHNALTRKRMDAIMYKSELLTFWRRCDIPASPSLLQAWQRIGIIFCGREREPGADVWTLLPWADNSLAVNVRWPAHVPKSVQHFQRVFKISTDEGEQAVDRVLRQVFNRAALLAAELVPALLPKWQQQHRRQNKHTTSSGEPAVSATFSTITDSVVLCWTDGVSALVSLEKVPGDNAAEVVVSLRCPENVKPSEAAPRLNAISTAVLLGIALSVGDKNRVRLRRVAFVCPHCLSVHNEFFSRTEFLADIVCSAADAEANSSKGSISGNSEKVSTILKCNTFSAVPPIKLSEIAPDIVAMTRDERAQFLADFAVKSDMVPRLTTQFDGSIASIFAEHKARGNEDDREEFYLGLLRAYPVTSDGHIPVQVPNTHKHRISKVTCATPVGPGKFAVGTERGNVIVWSEAKSSYVTSWRACCQSGSVLALAYWGSCIWVATDELQETGLVRVWSLTHECCLCTLYAPAFFANPPPLKAPFSLTVVGDSYVCGAFQASDPKCISGMLTFWDVRTFGLSYAFEVGLGGPSYVHYSAALNTLFVGTRGGCVIGYDVANGFREIMSIRACVPNPVLAIFVTGDHIWCSCGPTGFVRAYDIKEKRFLTLGFSESASEARIAPDLDHRATVFLPQLLCGRFLCGGNSLGRICLWDTVAMRPHRLHRPLSLHNLSTPVVALLPGAISDTVWVADAVSNLSVLAGPVPLSLKTSVEEPPESILSVPHHWAFDVSLQPEMGDTEKMILEIRLRLGMYEMENVGVFIKEKKSASADQKSQLPAFLLPPSRAKSRIDEEEKEEDLPACVAFKKFIRFLVIEYFSDQLCLRKIFTAGRGENALCMLFAGIGQPYKASKQVESMAFISRFSDVVDAAEVLAAIITYTYGEFFSKLTEDAAYLLAQTVLEIVSSEDGVENISQGTLAEHTIATLFFSKQEREPVSLPTTNHRITWKDIDVLQKSGIRLDNGDKYVFPDVELPENFPFRRSTESQAIALKMVKI